MSPVANSLILSCEHASRAIPRRYRSMFAGALSSLRGHEGHDLGAREISRRLAGELNVEVTQAKASRLLVDCNRSLHHRRLFSEHTRRLPPEDREEILSLYYHPYRNSVERRVEEAIAASGRAVHVSVHSFTGVMGGKRRAADIGLLYDPAREGERSFCAHWRSHIKASGVFTVRRNYPYKGVSDGLVSHFRKRWSGDAYLAVELELNQELCGSRHWGTLGRFLAQTLALSLDALQRGPKGAEPGKKTPGR